MILSPVKTELFQLEPQKTGTTVVECITGPPYHASSETRPRPFAWFAWFAFRDGTNPKAGPAAKLGGPPAVAVPAAAVTDARQTVATTAASTDLKFILAPFGE